MCGLAGRFHPVALPEARGWSEAACERLAHRGPDGAGLFADARCELVHRRLALIDLSPTGLQPMPNEDGSIQLVFNGEIYNHRELREDLRKRGHVFRGASDTEVIVHLYEELGVRFVERLRGIFALAIYDAPRCKLVLARDRFGVKPLFYAFLSNQWIFASEIKAMVALPGFRPRIDRQACYDYLGLGWVPEPATGFLEIAALPAGAILVVTPERSRVARHVSIVASPEPGLTLRATVERLATMLPEVVARQSLADVPVAALLSGGIDSSLVVAAHCRTGNGATTTFNVRFPDPEHDETPLARAVAEHCRTQHRTIDCDDSSLEVDEIIALFRHFDQPFADTSLIPTYRVATAIRQNGIVCALSGDGGDEAFGGYSRFWRASWLTRLMRSPAGLRGALQKIGSRLATRTRNAGRQLERAACLATMARRDPAVLLSGLSNYLREDEKESLLVPDARGGLRPCSRLFEQQGSVATPDMETVSRRITETQFAISLPSDMLRKVDMMSMRAGIEVRVPLLDDELVDLGLTLPHRLKTNGRKGKLVLRELARRWLPAEVARHPKHGFSIPLDVMVKPSFHRTVTELLAADSARTRPFLNSRIVMHWLSAFIAAGSGMRDAGISRGGLDQRIFTLFSLELWMRDHGLSW